MSTEEAAFYGDPITRPFWDAAKRHELLIQRCEGCRRSQFYPRAFCVHCESQDVRWLAARGTGTVYSVTTVHLKIVEHLDPPYQVGIVELDEGPRMLTNFIGACAIGQRVRVEWRNRDDAPPVPVFVPA